jgi:hypothetical protein
MSAEAHGLISVLEPAGSVDKMVDGVSSPVRPLGLYRPSTRVVADRSLAGAGRNICDDEERLATSDRADHAAAGEG